MLPQLYSEKNEIHHDFYESIEFDMVALPTKSLHVSWFVTGGNFIPFPFSSLQLCFHALLVHNFERWIFITDTTKNRFIRTVRNSMGLSEPNVKSK